MGREVNEKSLGKTADAATGARAMWPVHSATTTATLAYGQQSAE
jgi:hypothetical protein